MYRNKSLLSVFSPLASWLQKHLVLFFMALLKALCSCHAGIVADRTALLCRSAAPAPPCRLTIPRRRVVPPLPRFRAAAPPHRPTLPRGAASRLTSSTFPAGAGERFAGRSPLSPFPAGAGERLPECRMLRSPRERGTITGRFYRVFQKFIRITGICQQKKRAFVLFEPAARITREGVSTLRR